MALRIETTTPPEVPAAAVAVDGPRTGIEVAIEGSAEVNALGRYVAVGEAFARLLGHEPGALSGVSWWTTVDPRDHPKVYRAFDRMWTEPQVEVQCRAVRRDGASIRLLLLLVPMRDEWGQPDGHRVFGRRAPRRRRATRSVGGRYRTSNAVNPSGSSRITSTSST